ncbi:MAG: hypothetical protein KJ923_00690, partial [Candidatus Omnitrophica bacterium]|nr:hypothetical protein [Candidatus Omnitrophota bacterium]
CAQVAKTIFKIPKVLTRVYDPQRAQIYSALGLDIISGTVLFAAMLRDKIVESRFSSYLIESKDLSILEIEVKDKLVGKSVLEVNVPGELLVAAIKRINEIIIPDSHTVVQEKDSLMAVVKVSSLNKIKHLLGVEV